MSRSTQPDVLECQHATGRWFSVELGVLGLQARFAKPSGWVASRLHKPSTGYVQVLSKSRVQVVGTLEVAIAFPQRGALSRAPFTCVDW